MFNAYCYQQEDRDLLVINICRRCHKITLTDDTLRVWLFLIPLVGLFSVFINVYCR